MATTTATATPICQENMNPAIPARDSVIRISSGA